VTDARSAIRTFMINTMSVTGQHEVMKIGLADLRVAEDKLVDLITKMAKDTEPGDMRVPVDVSLFVHGYYFQNIAEVDENTPYFDLLTKEYEQSLHDPANAVELTAAETVIDSMIKLLIMSMSVKPFMSKVEGVFPGVRDKLMALASSSDPIWPDKYLELRQIALGEMGLPIRSSADTMAWMHFPTDPPSYNPEIDTSCFIQYGLVQNLFKAYDT
jgi:hypothetical protein